MQLYYLVSPFCIVGALSNILIISAFIRRPDILKIYEYQFILVFSILDLITTLSSLLPSLLFPENHTLCKIQGILIQTSSLSGIFFIGLIAVAILREFVLLRRRFSGFFKPLAIIFSFSALTSLLPLLFNSYQITGNWCWFENPSKGDYTRDYLLRFFLYYLYVWSVIIFNFIVTVLVKYKFKKETIFDFVGNRLVNRLKWYPWILAMCYTPLTIVRVTEGITTLPLWYTVFSGILLRLISFFNSIAFFILDKSGVSSPNSSGLNIFSTPLKESNVNQSNPHN